LVRLYTKNQEDHMLGRIQNDLFDMGADLCIPAQNNAEKPALRITETHVTRLEKEIDDMNKNLSPLTSFILPGGSNAAAFLHQARGVIRRAERILVNLAEEEWVNPDLLKYINRLSDHSFVLARHLNASAGGDVLWEPGKYSE
jgi:cob(I)alamin adenosyltransferase